MKEIIIDLQAAALISQEAKHLPAELKCENTFYLFYNLTNAMNQ